MRAYGFAVALFLAGAGAAQAQDAAGTVEGVDCGALTTSNMPYQLTYVARPLNAGEQLTLAMVDQAFRGEGAAGQRLRRFAGRTAVSTVDSHYGFMTGLRESVDGREVQTSITIEVVDPTADHLAGQRDFTYVRHVRLSTGGEQIDDNVMSFRGEQSMTVSGCTFRAVVWNLERRYRNPRAGQPASIVTRIWYVPELRGYLRFQSLGAEGAVTRDLTAVSIETSFERFE